MEGVPAGDRQEDQRAALDHGRACGLDEDDRYVEDSQRGVAARGGPEGVAHGDRVGAGVGIRGGGDRERRGRLRGLAGKRLEIGAAEPSPAGL